MDCVYKYASEKQYQPLNRHHAEWARVLKEHRCWLAFLEAHDAYDEWHKLLLEKRLEQDEFERYEKRYGQPGGGGQQTGYVPLQAAYPHSARESQHITDDETWHSCKVEAKHFGANTGGRVQQQADDVMNASMKAEKALMMVLDFNRSRWNLVKGE